MRREYFKHTMPKTIARSANIRARESLIELQMNLNRDYDQPILWP